MAPEEGEIAVFVTAGDAPPQVESLELPNGAGRIVAVSFLFGPAATISVTFTAAAFLALAEQFRQVAAALPDRPS